MTVTSNGDGKSKEAILREQGAFNRGWKEVSDELFLGSSFFDPRDQVQVKYEMLRRVGVDGQSVTETTAGFGVSRPSFYKARSAFEREGLPGLVPGRPGPRGGHKLTDEVMEFVASQLLMRKDAKAPLLAELVEERFGLKVHPRSIERALSRRQKKPRQGPR